MTNQSYLYNGHMLSHKRKQAKEKKKDNMRKTSKGSSGPLPETHSFFPFLFLCLTKKNKPNLFSLYKSLPFSFSFHNSQIKTLTKKNLFSHSFLALGSHSKTQQAPSLCWKFCQPITETANWLPNPFFILSPPIYPPLEVAYGFLHSTHAREEREYLALRELGIAGAFKGWQAA